MADLNKAIKTGGRFSFTESLAGAYGGEVKRSKRTPFQFWEGHRLPEFCQQAMRDVGLIDSKEKPFTIYPLRNSLLYQIKARKR